MQNLGQKWLENVDNKKFLNFSDLFCQSGETFDYALWRESGQCMTRVWRHTTSDTRHEESVVCRS